MKKTTLLLILIASATLCAGTSNSKKQNKEAAPTASSESSETQNENDTRAALVKKAREHMSLDNDIYSAEQRREIEGLYQSISKNWQKDEGEKALNELLKKYKTANRTGCAILYLGQMNEGKKREEYLNKAITEYNDCYYGNGVQVGAYARYLLGIYYMQNKQEKKAEKLFEEIKKHYPDAINHKGMPLVQLIEKQSTRLKK